MSDDPAMDGSPADGAPGPSNQDPPADAPLEDVPPPGDSSAAWGAPYGDPLPPAPPVPAWPEEEEEQDVDDGDDGHDLEEDDDVQVAARGAGPSSLGDADAAMPVPLDSPSAARAVPPRLIGVAVVGLLVGVAFVLAGLALRSPSPEASATGSVRPSVGIASAAPEASSPAASASAPGAPVRLVLTKAKASSVAGDRAKFQPDKAIDGDKGSAWEEGATQEKGEWIRVAFDPSRADTLVIRNGYQASPAEFRATRRLKDVLISVDRARPIPFRLTDTAKPQQIELGGVSGARSVRIKIVSTYPGEATAVQGSPLDDAAVSEITVLGVPGG